MSTNNREKFSTSLAIFFATLGSALGLGNIWKFPYLTGKFGGGAFLLIYSLSIFLIGIPVMLSEFYIGRKTKKNPIGAFEHLRPNTAWSVIGYMGVISSYLVIFFYTDVAGWVYSYFFKSLMGSFNNVSKAALQRQFDTTIIGPLSPLFWKATVLLVVSLILILGVQKGIEKITKTLLPLFFILIIITAIRSLSLPNSNKGVAFLFTVNFKSLGSIGILTALGLAFFKLSLGMGSMITYSGYFTDNNNMLNTAFHVALSDTIVSVLAGLAIFPAVFAFNIEPSAGPGLLFITIPLVFSQIPFGNFLLIGFFFLSCIVATTAMISMVEVLVVLFKEKLGTSRTTSVLLNSLIIFCIGSLATLSAHPHGLLGGFLVFGKSFFDLFDYFSSNILLPLGGLLTIIFVGYIINRENFIEELSNNKKLKNTSYLRFIFFVLKYISPILLIIVFLNSLGLLKF